MKNKNKKHSDLENALMAYIDYFVGRGAKRVDIDFKGGTFRFKTDVGLAKEELESEEHQTLIKNLQAALMA